MAVEMGWPREVDRDRRLRRPQARKSIMSGRRLKKVRRSSLPKGEMTSLAFTATPALRARLARDHVSVQYAVAWKAVWDGTRCRRATVANADWSLRDRLVEILAAAPPSEVPRLQAAVGVMFEWPNKYRGPLAPSYPKLHLPFAARVALGESVTDLAPCLTKAEAHEWASLEGYTMPQEWLCNRHDIPYVRDIEVARWLIACKTDAPRWEALHRERRLERDGFVRTFCYLGRVDEIEPCDLVHGTRTGVETVMRRAAERFTQNHLAQYEQDQRTLTPVPSWWRPVRCATLLRTPAALVAEGRELRHCVGVYAPMVERGESVIVALRVPEWRDGVTTWHRSTVEMTPDGSGVRQHFGEGNEEPSALCQRALAVIQLRRAS